MRGSTKVGVTSGIERTVRNESKSPLTQHPAPLHPSHLAPHISHLAPHTSYFTTYNLTTSRLTLFLSPFGCHHHSMTASQESPLPQGRHRYLGVPQLSSGCRQHTLFPPAAHQKKYCMGGYEVRRATLGRPGGVGCSVVGCLWWCW